MSSRRGFADVIAAAKSQAAVTGLLGAAAPESGAAQESERVGQTGLADPVVAPTPSPIQPPAVEEPPRSHGAPEAISWVADLTASRQGDWLTVYGVPVPLPKGTDEESVTMSFRCPRWLREAVHMRCRQYGVEVQEFGQAALAVVLAQLQAAEKAAS
jgi:hypothetical protein